MADKIDPFDVRALGDAVNDSASRVSTIWVTFLIFSLYMLVAAGTVTQRQLFLDEPTKLPVLNIDLPLWWFFLLAPILFVIFHVYVLLQVLLLGRTTAAYNSAVVPLGLSPEENASLRQRLANTIFAQTFAGSPREREGFVGMLLRSMVWITLAAAPILIVLAFQLRFLPYHSNVVTWTHRLLILIELAAFFFVWPLALDAQRDFQSSEIRADLWRFATLPIWVIGTKSKRNDACLWLHEHWAPLSACLLYILIPLSLVTFPGEPLVNLFTGESLVSVQCTRWLSGAFDRLILPRIDIFLDDKLSTTEQAMVNAKKLPFEGQPTHSFSGRDLSCSDLSSSNLRRANFDYARMTKVALAYAKLEGATFVGAHLEGTHLGAAQLQRADFRSAELQGAAFFMGITLSDGRPLGSSNLQGAILSYANLEGALLDGAQLNGADLEGAQLLGASLRHAQFRGANFDFANLIGASVVGAQFEGSSFNFTNLHGVDFSDAALDHSVLSRVHIRHAKITTAACANTRVTEPLSDSTFSATPDEISKFAERIVAKIPNPTVKEKVAAQIREALTMKTSKEEMEAFAKVWNSCEDLTANISQGTFDKQRAALLRSMACDAPKDRKAIALGIIRNWISAPDAPPSALSIQLARDLLGQDEKPCEATKDFDEDTLGNLREAAAKEIPTVP